MNEFQISVVLLFVLRPTNASVAQLVELGVINRNSCLTVVAGSSPAGSLHGTLGAHGIERLSETQSHVGGPIPLVPISRWVHDENHNTTHKLNSSVKP